MLMGVHPVLRVFGDWGFGDSQSLKPHPDEHPTQPIEASQLGVFGLMHEREASSERIHTYILSALREEGYGGHSNQE